MKRPLPKTYVSFVFSPAFINESKGRETQLFEEANVTDIEPGTLARVLDRYKEVEVASRDLRALQVPKGALYFWFYDRLIVTTQYKGDVERLQSRPLESSGLYYMENEGSFYNLNDLLGTKKYPHLLPSMRKDLIDLLNKHGVSRMLRVDMGGGDWSNAENFFLYINDFFTSPDKVQMVETEIPWRK